ncbi:MAG: ROK family protein [Oscillospiraceae bacterium]|jgi:allose kinase|nr:ROK family protein [Oscillospiraceae bacterium]
MNEIIGVDIGGTHIRLGNPEKPGSVSRFRTAERDAVATIADYCKGRGVTAMGVGVPGLLDKACRRAMKVPNIPALNGRDLAGELEAATGAKVYLENDTVVLLTGDIARMKLTESGVVLGIYIGTGLGSGLFINNKPYKGKYGYGTELGHVPIYGFNEACGCGGKGCAETVVAGGALVRLRDKNYPGTDISDLFTVLTDADRTQYIEALAVVLAGTLNLLDPDVIILGGGVAQMRGFPLEEVKRGILEHAVKPYPAEGFTILTVPLDETIPAGVYGAWKYALLNEQ